MGMYELGCNRNDMMGDDVLGDDVLGDDVLGDMDGDVDGDDIMGADLMGLEEMAAHLAGIRNPFRRKKAMKQALLAKRVQSATVLPREKTIASHGFPLGFTNLATAASATVNVNAQPQVKFKGKRLVIPAVIGVNFAVVSITIGNRLEFVAAGAVPALTYSETAVGTSLSLHWADVGQLIVLQVTNTDAANPHDFRATLIGTALEKASC